MCLSCGYEPYLAGRVVIFELEPKSIPTRTPDGYADVQIRDRPRGYTGVCVRHHHGWVTIRTKREMYNIREDKVLAIIEKEKEVNA